MFTDRFIKLPTDMVNEKLKNLTGNDGCYESLTYVLPMDICEYHETKYEDQNGTQIYLKNGRGFMINMTIKEFENILNQYAK